MGASPARIRRYPNARREGVKHLTQRADRSFPRHDPDLSWEDVFLIGCMKFVVGVYCSFRVEVWWVIVRPKETNELHGPVGHVAA